MSEWFHKFTNDEFDVEDKKPGGRPKLEALVNEDSCKME